MVIYLKKRISLQWMLRKFKCLYCWKYLLNIYKSYCELHGPIIRSMISVSRQWMWVEKVNDVYLYVQNDCIYIWLRIKLIIKWLIIKLVFMPWSTNIFIIGCFHSKFNLYVQIMKALLYRHDMYTWLSALTVNNVVDLNDNYYIPHSSHSILCITTAYIGRAKWPNVNYVS